jgi:hypothetical protein
MEHPTKKRNTNTVAKTKIGAEMKSLFSLLLFMVLFSANLFACAGSYAQMYIKDEYYNFTDPDMVNLPRDNPLYQLSGSYSAHDARFQYFAQKKREANIEAWKVYFKDAYSTKELEALFYKKNSIEKSAKFYHNSTRYPHFGRYIDFLNLQNRLAQKDETSNYEKVLAEGLKLFKEETEPFLKERYLYLLMRLYHHHEAYQKALNLYANNLLVINPKGVVKEWIDALRAGAYQHLKQTTKANQLYARIFQNNQTNPHYGYYDFKVNSDEAWQELLESSDNNETKALYHFLRAMKWRNEPLHELESIASLAPNSVWFERLSYMMMQELQNRRYNIMLHAGKKDEFFRAKVKSYKLKKERFLAILKSVKKQTFFTLYSQLFLNVLEYNSLKRQDLAKLATLANEKQKPYAELLNYIYAVHQLSSSSAEEQYGLYQQLKPILSKLSKKKQNSILRYTTLQLATINREDPIEHTLNKLFAQNENYRGTILEALNYANASKFKAYIEKKRRTFFEQRVFKKTMSNLHKGDVAKILATLYLQENNFKQAQFYLRQVPKQNLFSPYNPFNATINGSNRTLSKSGYSQKKFIETLLRIEDTLKKNPKSAMDHFLYANALYNKSWFGNFPLSSVLYRNTTLMRGEKPPKTTDLSEAQREYELALKYANFKDRVKNENFKAKVAYQLLKIKFNLAISDTYKYEKEQWSPPRFGASYYGTKSIMKLLKESRDFTEAIRDFRAEYQHTDYAKEVIKRCVTFRYF